MNKVENKPMDINEKLTQDNSSKKNSCRDNFKM